MKLLIANHQLDRLAGSELHTLDLCRGFRRAGHEVCVFTLEPGLITRQMQGEGFPVYTERNVLELVEAPPDVIYLHHSTCEVFLGIVFAGKVPIVRGFVSRQGPSATPTNGGFLSGALYISREVRDAISPQLKGIAEMIAPNVYDETEFGSTHTSDMRESLPASPNFAVVSNHGDTSISEILSAGKSRGKCRYTWFGGSIDSRVPITREVLMSFDAVITLGRTAICASAMGKPVFVADIHGSDGWIYPHNFEDLQSRNFSGRFYASKDADYIGVQLFDRSLWPGEQDLTWLSERVERDHGLSGRIRELEEFFSEVIENSPPPAFVPDGYRGVYNFLRRSGKHAGVAGDTPARSKKEMKHLKSCVSELENELHSIKSSRVFRAMRLAENLKAALLGRAD